jgi:hypothetical protein
MNLIFLSFILRTMNLPGPIHDFFLVFLGLGLILGGPTGRIDWGMRN